MVRSLLSEPEAKKIEAAVARVERTTAAELVVAVVPRSAPHLSGRVVWAIAWAFAAGLGFLYLEPWREPALALFVEVAVGLLTFALSGLPGLHRLLLSPAAAEQAVQARAFQLFAERGLYGTRGHTGLLLFVSELERRVVLLGDRSIDQELGQPGWQEHVGRLVAALRDGKACDGILDLLARLEPRLAAVAPPLEHNENELPDALVRR